MIDQKEIRKARLALGLTQEQAGEVIGATRRAWQDWELGQRNMPPAKWELFQIKTRGREMKPFKTIRTPEGWYVGVAVEGRLFGRKVELGQPTAETLANSLDDWYRDNGREWLEGEIRKGYLTEIPRSTLIMGNGMKGWQDRQDVLWEKVLKDRL